MEAFPGIAGNVLYKQYVNIKMMHDFVKKATIRTTEDLNIQIAFLKLLYHIPSRTPYIDYVHIPTGGLLLNTSEPCNLNSCWICMVQFLPLLTMRMLMVYWLSSSVLYSRQAPLFHVCMQDKE